MHRILIPALFAWTLVWWAAFPVRAQELPVASLQQKVEKLAAALDADKEVERDQAEAELLAIGADALVFLPPIDEDASDEWKMRMERVRATILDQDKQQMASPTRVTLSAAMSGREALSMIGRSTNNPLTLDKLPQLDEIIELELDNVTYWEAIDEALDKLDLVVAPNDGELLQLIPRNLDTPQRAAMAAYAGSFRMEPIAIEKSLKLYQPELSSTRVEVSLAWEPRLSPVFVRFALDDLELVCDNGEILKPKPDQGSDFTPSGNQLIALLEFDLPTRAAREVVTWRGTVDVSIPGKPVSLSFSELESARNTKLTVGDLQVVLERCRKNRDIYEVMVGVSLSGEHSSDSLQGWTSLIDAHLLDADGMKIEHAGWSTTRMTDKDTGLSFLFELENDLSGYRFVFRAPQSVLQQQVEFSLQHVPLP